MFARYSDIPFTACWQITGGLPDPARMENMMPEYFKLREMERFAICTVKMAGDISGVAGTWRSMAGQTVIYINCIDLNTDNYGTIDTRMEPGRYNNR